MLDREIRETRELVSCYALAVLKGARRFIGYQRIPPDASLGTERGPSRPAARPCVAYRANVSLWLVVTNPPALMLVRTFQAALGARTHEGFAVIVGSGFDIGLCFHRYLLVIGYFLFRNGKELCFFPPMVSLRENRFRKIMKKFSAAERGPSRPAALRTLLVASKPAPNMA